MNKTKIIKLAGVAAILVSAFGIEISSNSSLLAIGIGLCFGADILGELIDNLT